MTAILDAHARNWATITHLGATTYLAGSPRNFVDTHTQCMYDHVMLWMPTSNYGCTSVNVDANLQCDGRPDYAAGVPRLSVGAHVKNFGRPENERGWPRENVWNLPHFVGWPQQDSWATNGLRMGATVRTRYSGAYTSEPTHAPLGTTAPRPRQGFEWAHKGACAYERGALWARMHIHVCDWVGTRHTWRHTRNCGRTRTHVKRLAPTPLGVRARWLSVRRLIASL